MADKDFVVKNGIVASTNSLTVGSALTVNTTGFYHAGTVNATSHTVGSSTIANSTGIYASTVNATSVNSTSVNASSYAVGSSLLANSTQLYVGGTFIANSTGPYGKTEGSLSVGDSSKLGGTVASSYRLKSDGQVLPSTTAIAFKQTTAPTGFTKLTTFDDCAMRIVSGAVGSGGTMNFSSAFASSRSFSGTTGTTTATNQAATQGGNISSTTATNQAATQGGNISTTTATNQAATQGGNISSYTLTVSDLPSHSHGVTDPGHSHGIRWLQRTIDGSQFDGDGSLRSNSAFAGGYIEATSTNISLQTTGLSGGHNHLFTGSSHTHTQDAHSHTFTGSSHNHTQDAHGHTFTGSSHNHTQDAHSHTFGSSLQFDVKYVDFILATAD